MKVGGAAAESALDVLGVGAREAAARLPQVSLSLRRCCQRRCIRARPVGLRMEFGCQGFGFGFWVLEFGVWGLTMCASKVVKPQCCMCGGT